VRPSVAARVKAYVEEQTGGRTSKEKKRNMDWSAVTDGRKDGKEVQVRKPLDT